MIGKLLGHTRVQSTARYAHVGHDFVRQAAAKIAASNAEDILGEQSPTTKLSKFTRTTVFHLHPIPPVV